MNIGEYLISKDFRILLKESNLENLWELCREIRAYNDNSGIAIFSHGYTGYAEETFEIFLNELYNGNKESFLRFIKVLLIDFFKWRKNREYSKIPKEILIELKEYLNSIMIEDKKGINNEYIKLIDEIFNEIQKYNKNPSIRNRLFYNLRLVWNFAITQLTQKVKFLGVEGPIWFILVVLLIIYAILAHSPEIIKTLIGLLK